MGFPTCILEPSPAVLWWLGALLTPCLLALIPSGTPSKGGRP